MWEVGVEDGHPQHTTTITMRLNRIYDQRQHALPRSFDHPMTTITAPTIGIIDNTISVNVETDLNADARMTNSNVMITQDDSMAASTGGLLLSQDTISSVDFVDSQQHETTDLAAAVTAIKQQPLLPPPLLVQCPNVSDVLFPMEGFKMWPANVYCEIILQQYEAKCIAIWDNQERQAKLVQDIIHLIRSQQNANDNINVVKCGGRFLKAIQVPYRMHKLNQQHESNDQPTEDNNSNNTVNGDVTSSKTIWEVMHEADAMKVLSKILLARCTKTSQEDNTNDQNESIPPRHNERSSQIAASSLAILQGLYYVPNYYPSRTERRPHEYDSHGSDDDESYASLSDNDDDDDDEENEQEAIRIKKRRLIHCSTDDFKCKNPSETSNQRPKGKRPTSANKKSSCPPHSKVSMIGRVLVNNDGDERCSAHQVSSAEDPIHHSSTIDLHQHNNYTKASFHFFKPQKSMKSQQAMIEQEGSDDLPKGVTVRPSGKWVRVISFWSTAPFPQSLTLYPWFLPL